MEDISIIIPTRNRAYVLRKTLESIAGVVATGNNVEILIVDNDSVDNTKNICQEIRHEFPSLYWRYIYEKTPGLLAGRHRGAREAQSEILVFLDDDVLLVPAWMEALREAFCGPEVMYVGGPVLPHYEVEPPSWLAGMWYDFDGGIRVLGELSLIDQGPSVKETGPRYVAGGNCAIRKAALKACGGFNPDGFPKPLLRYRGDGEIGLALKIEAEGLKAVFHPGLAVKHVISASRLTPEIFEQKGFHQGVSNSYSAVRRAGFLSSDSRSWKDLLRPLKWRVEREKILRGPTAKGVRCLVARARVAGKRFHEGEVRRDPRLLEWVLKQDYFDYELPCGWEKYMSNQAPSPSHWR